MKEHGIPAISCKSTTYQQELSIPSKNSCQELPSGNGKLNLSPVRHSLPPLEVGKVGFPPVFWPGHNLPGAYAPSYDFLLDPESNRITRSKRCYCHELPWPDISTIFANSGTSSPHTCCSVKHILQWAHHLKKASKDLRSSFCLPKWGMASANGPHTE